MDLTPLYDALKALSVERDGQAAALAEELGGLGEAQAAGFAAQATRLDRAEARLTALEQRVTKLETATPPPSASRAVLLDERFATIDPARWTVRNNTYNSNEASYLLARNVTAGPAGLRIRALREAAGGKQFTSGYIDSKGKLSWQYGRFEVTARFPTGQGVGLWPALWLRPDDGGLGEIDIAEAWSKFGTDEVTATVHHDYLTGTGHLPHVGKVLRPAGFDSRAAHVYALEWTATAMVFSIDGTDLFTVNQANCAWYADVAHKPYHWRLNLQVGGSYGGLPDAATVFPADLVIERLRVLAPLP